MSLFKKMVTRAGKVNFFRDGKAVKDPEILPAVVKNMDPGVTIEISEQEPTPATVKQEKPAKESRLSVISGEPGTKQRFLNGKAYWVTSDEHREYTLGKLAQVIRDKGL